MAQMTTYERDTGCYCHALYCNSFCDTCLTFYSTRPQEKAEEQRKRAEYESDMQSARFSVHV